MSIEAVRAEIELLATGGMINPARVVEWARENETSALHGKFTWDDTEAAEKWRVDEARRLIRVFVIAPVTDGQAPTRAFVSLTTERGADGGYRALASVLSDERMKAQLLADAMTELRAMRAKYARLTELAEVFAAAEKVEKRASGKSATRANSRVAA
jgi:hypothetical protein